MKDFRDLGFNLSDTIDGAPYFKWAEALWLPSVQAYALPNEIQIKNIEKQARALSKVREHFNAPIIITSWLRPVKYNGMIGGAPNSRHLYGTATDFFVKGFTCNEVKSVLQNNRDLYPGRGEKDTVDWVHLDLSPGDWFYGRRSSR